MALLVFAFFRVLLCVGFVLIEVEIKELMEQLENVEGDEENEYKTIGATGTTVVSG